jgi:hypothetical protein
MAKRIDPKAKAKRQKIYAAVGGVILLGVLAFQVPRTMKMLKQSNGTESASSASAPATTTTGPIAAPSLSGGNATAVSSSGGDGLSDPDLVPAPQSGQLLAFGRFRTKDPFVQQLDPRCEATDAGSTSCSSSTAPAKAPVKTVAAGSANAPKNTAPSSNATPTTAVIIVNGVSQTVTVGGSFPSADPAFTLISLTRSTAKVGIAGGSFESGQPAVTLKKNKPLTLMNTADGTRYVLRLLALSS